jgi:tetratricopeptide (TPR) repeat protein
MTLLSPVLLLSTFLLQSDPALVQRQVQQGEKALAEGRYADAASAFEELRRLAPGMAEVHARLGLIYYQQRRFEIAVGSLRRALELKPELPNLGVLLAMSLSELGRYDEALPGLREGFGQGADAALRRASGLQLQRALTGLARFDEGVAVALELARLYPEDPEILYHSGRLFSHFAYLQTMKLARVAPESAWMRQAAGEANESQGLHDAAVREYRELLEMAPNRPGVRFRIARALLSKAEQAPSPGAAAGARAEAVGELEQELALDPTNADAAYELGEIHRKEGRHDAARRWFAQAVEHYPDFEQARIGLGRVLLAQGEPAAAVEQLEAAIALNAESEVAFYQLSLCHRALGDAERQRAAMAEFQRLKSGASSRSGMADFVPLQVTEQKIDEREPDERQP